MKHEPLAYIRGKQEFYGRDFSVSPAVLTPRPETESMINLLLRDNPAKIIDVGTGSGCIAITIKLELLDCEAYASDVSTPALAVAQKNAKKYTATVTFLESNLLLHIPKDILSDSVLCCNLPYVPTTLEVNFAAKHEPEIALFSGKDGLNHYRELFGQLQDLSNSVNKPSPIFTESLPFQHKELEKIAKTAGYILDATDGLVQKFTLR
jgi:release factor glutamine methyltransferase